MPTAAQVLTGLNRRGFLPALVGRPQVKRFHAHRKGDGKIKIPFGNMKAQSIGDQGDTHQNQKAQRQHLDGQMGVDKAA